MLFLLLFVLLLNYRFLVLWLLLLSHISRVQLCATPQTAAQQAPLSLGFSRQEYWSGLPFPSPIMKVKSESEVSQSCSTLSDPMDCSLPGSSIHGIFQARILEWGAIAFSGTEVVLLKKTIFFFIQHNNNSFHVSCQSDWFTSFPFKDTADCYSIFLNIFLIGNDFRDHLIYPCHFMDDDAEALGNVH